MDLDFSTAPDAAIEDHGIQARGRSFWGEVLAPSTASDGWSLFILFRDHIVKRAPWSVHEVNLKTGVVTPHAGVWDEPSQIHAFSDGRVYVMLGPSCLRLNPKTQSFEKIAVPRGAYWYWRPAREGMVFLCCADDGRVARLNTETDEVLDFGLVGQGGGGLLARMWEYGDVTGEGEILTPFGVDDHAAFVVLGQLPRTLWALNLETREQRMLLCVADPDRMAILQREKGCFALVRRREGDEVYRLTAEKAEGVKRLPPRDPESAPMVAGIPRPEIPPRLAMPVGDYQGTGMCEADGTATVHYRPSGEDWKTASIDLTDYPSYLFRMGSTSDGRLLCSSEDPYTIFTFDPGSSTCEILGPSPYYTHAYAFAELGDRIYFTGYTGAPLFEYDPGRPWTYQPARPDACVPLPEDPDANPRLVARMPRMRRAYDIAAGLDGRLYLPCSAEMSGPCASGGGLGWYEPATGRAGMIREGFEMHLGASVAPALNGRYMVVSATAWWPGHIEPETSGVPSRLVTYDVEAGAVIGDVEPWRHAAGGGAIAEWRPGLVVARFGTARNHEPEALFLILDVASQAIVSTHRLRGTSSNRLLRLPDGDLAGLHGDGIYRLDPERWSFEPICKLDKAPRDWQVVNGKVFAFLDTRLVELEIL